MAIDRSVRYPGRFDTPTTARPQGAFKNRAAPGAKDGSYLERDWANDWDGFFGSLLRSAGMTANGTPDTALESQYFDAMRALGLRQATEPLIGVAAIATQVETNEGASDTKFVTPKKLRFGFQALFSSAGYLVFPTWMGGFIIQWNTGHVLAQGGTINTTAFPIPFPNEALTVVVGGRNNMVSATAYSVYLSDGAGGTVGPVTNTGFKTRNTGATGSAGISFIAVGR